MPRIGVPYSCMVTQVLMEEGRLYAASTPTGETDASGGMNAVPAVPDQSRLPLDALARLFAALGEPTRLRIVAALSNGELRVGDLAAGLGVAVPAVSQHLRVLRELRLVRNRRAGKSIYYALDARIADLFAITLAHLQGEKE